MNELTINHYHHKAINPDAQVGDEVTLTITALITRIEADPVDITSYRSRTDGSSVALGERTTTLVITNVEPAAKP